MISATISSAEAPYTKVSPITCSIVFSSALDPSTFTISDITTTNCSVIQLTGGPTTWQAIVSPNAQGDTISVYLPANKVETPFSEANSASNTLSLTFNSVKPRVLIEHEMEPITNAHFMKSVITFERPVTGFAEADLDLTNCLFQSLTPVAGSVTSYKLVLVPKKAGRVNFFVKAGAGSDVYGNTSAKSNEITLEYDPTPIEEKSDIVYGEIDDPDVLIDFTVDDLNQVAAINVLADCAKDIPQRLLAMATDKAFDIIANNPTVKKLAGAVVVASAAVDTIESIVDMVQTYAEQPETLMKHLLEASGLTGEALRAKKQYIADTFGAITGLDSIIATALSSGVCGQTDYYADGSTVPTQILTPSNMVPPGVSGVESGATNTYDSTPKDAYDEFAFKLKETLEIEDATEQDPDRAAMISVVTTLAMGYHDDVSKTIDATKDADLLAKYQANVELEKQKNLGWSSDIKTSFTTRTNLIGSNISRNTQVIRNFYNRNSPTTGTLLSVGVTTYSGPADDFMTYLDIKPEQRPPELTAKYQAQGRKIPTGNTYTNSANETFRIGTLNLSDAFNGAYGPIVSDKTCASTRVPGGSVLALRNPDGTAYDPTGNNPSGHYTVTDTGNSRETYQKPDIFTMTPRMYTNTGSVQVYLVSKGTQMKSQYKLAQRTYGGNTA